MSSDYAGRPGSKRRIKRRIPSQGQLLEQVTEAVPTTPRTSLSPRWSSTTKLLVGLVIVTIVGFLIVRFTSLITPLLMVFILAYLLHPVATAISRGLHISWKAAVNILYLIILLLILGSLAASGVGLVNQVQNLITQVEKIVTSDLPKFIESLSGRVFQIGPFTLDMRTVNINAVSQQVLSYVQPLLGRTGNLVTALASGAAAIFGWTFFVLIVSYFLMVESSGLQSDLIKVEIPGYSADLRKLGSKLSNIWNAFLRGQIFIVVFSAIIYMVLLSLLGVRYAIGIAIMAGLAKFLPYIGPAITWVVLALVTYFQSSKPLNLEDRPFTYVIIVVIALAVVDWIIDNLIAPRIMARSLKVHPAAVLVVALIAANLLGILGVVIAAPLLATFMLVGRYLMRKMFDLDPWPPGESVSSHPMSFEWLTRARALITSRFRRMTAKPTSSPKERSNE
jgi:predicted PurR-regulated permease PerM